jgi:predicted TIM-barrel fold metal-dependent hydrolase
MHPTTFSNPSTLYFANNHDSKKNLMRSPSQGFGQLHSLGLSFDLQANPSQLQPFASAYANLPDAPDVIIDHM